MRQLHRLLLVILLGTIQPGFAMQLGASKGSAVFGRPLDLTIPVRFDAPVEDPFNCFVAEVFQADAKFDAGRVRIDVTPASNGLDAMVRIRSNTAVIEPWAKVILRNNCGAKVTRQYDFLTDFVADLPATNAPADSAIASNNLPTTNFAANSPNAQNLQNSQPSSVSSALPTLPAARVSNWSVKRAQIATQVTNQASLQTPTKPRRVEKPAAVEPKRTVLAATPVNPLGQVAQLGQSRLKMETFDLADEHQVLLKLSTAMIAPTGMRTPEEIQALAQATAVWRAINGLPVAAAVSPPAPVIAATTTAAQTKPSAVLKDGKHEFSNPIVYGLMGLLALTLACIAWLWFHVRRGTQPGYGWLEETAIAQAPIQTEPTQFVATSFTDTSFVPEQADVNTVKALATVDSLSEAEFEASRLQLAEAGVAANPLAVLLTNTEAIALKREKTSAKISAQEKISGKFSAAKPSERSPEHFDDSRFDEQQLVTKFNTSLVQVDVLNALNESVDFVVPDALPKLRSVPTPVVVADSESELNLTPSPSEKGPAEFTRVPANLSKKDLSKEQLKELSSEQTAGTKGNLIDFEVFAEPVPLPKPSRFAR